MKEERIRYYDVLRVASFFVIMAYHALCEAAGAGLMEQRIPDSLPVIGNVSLVIAAVSVFFMLSGAGLMCKANQDFSVKAFYRKRFARIIVPFWVTIVVGFIALSILRGRTFWMPSDVPLWRWISVCTGIVSFHVPDGTVLSEALSKVDNQSRQVFL